MNKLGKKVYLWILSALIVLCMCGLVACGDDSEQRESVTYAITVSTLQHGSVTADKQSASEGDVVTLTVTPDSGYALEQLLVDGTVTTVSTAGKANFTMPAKDVTVNATFIANSYAVTTTTTAGGTIKADKSNAAVGDTVTVTLDCDYGYAFKSLTMNQTELTVTNGTATFTMPANDVTLEATYELASNVVTDILLANTIEVNAKAAAGATATANTIAEYLDNGLKISVFVTDKKLVFTSDVTDDKISDSVEVYVGLTGYDHTSLSQINYGVKVGVSGLTVQYAVSEGAYVVTDNGAFESVSVVPWAPDSATISGYVATMTIPYEKLGLTDKAAAEGNVTLLTVLNNSDNSITPSSAVYNAYSVENPAQYVVVGQNGMFEENYYAIGVGQLGSSSLVEKASSWDLSKDYAKEDPLYTERQVTVSTAGADQNLLFYRTEGSKVYAEATFKMGDTYASEAWGKFGLMLFDGADKQGVFFYVDAATTGTDQRQFGYNAATTGAWGAWSVIAGTGYGTKNYFNWTTKTVTMALAYDGEWAFLWIKNADGNWANIAQVYYVANGKVTVGFKSFNIGLTVTDYMATNDADVIAAHSIEVQQQAVDALFAGDSYVDFWNQYGVWDSLTTEITGGAGNVGVGGTQVSFWNNTSKVGELKKRFTFNKIAFHIGVNDLDDASITVDQTYANLVDMFDLYHREFPDAQIYWISLIPNNFYPINNQNINDSYELLNSMVKAYMEGKSYLTYIDVATAFKGNSATGARTNLLMSDGLHLNPVNGYPLWTSIIKTAMGYTVPDGTVFGYNENVYLASTGGWTFDGDYAAEIPAGYTSTLAEELAVYTAAEYESSVLFEAELRAPSHFIADNYSKVGVVLRNDDYTIFAYLEANSAGAADGANVTYASMVVRGNGTYGVADWNWNYQIGTSIAKVNITTDFVKVGIAKQGNVIYLLINGEVVAQGTFAGITADTKFIPGVMTFSRTVQVKSVKYANDITRNDSRFAVLNVVNGNLEDEVWTDTVLDKAITVTNGNNAKITMVGVNTTNGILLGFTVLHNQPADNALVSPGDAWYRYNGLEIRLNGDTGTQIAFTVWNNQAFNCIAAHTTVANAEGSDYKYTTVYEVFVPYSEYGNISQSDAISLSFGGTVVDGAFTWANGGDNWNVTNYVTSYGVVKANEYLKDMSWMDTVADKTANVDVNNTNVTIYGKTTNMGIQLAFEIKHNKPVTEKIVAGDDAWFRYLNVELRLAYDMDKQIAASVYNEFVTGCTAYFTTGANTKGGDYAYLTTFNMLIPHATFNTNKDSVVSMTLGGVWDTGFAWALGGLNGFKYDITPTGIVDNTVMASLNGVLDDAIYTDAVKASTVTTTSANGAKFEMMGVNTEYGVRLAVTVSHNRAISDVLQSDGSAWWNYQNLELRMNGDSDKQIAFAPQTNYYSYGLFGSKTVTNAEGSEYAYTTTYEILIAYTTIGATQSDIIGFVIASVNDGGFNFLYGAANWDNEVNYVTSTGIRQLHLNGELDDTLFTDAVRSKVKHEVVGTGTVDTIAVKTSTGIAVYMTINHQQAIDTAFYGDGSDYHQYQFIEMNFGLRVGNVAAAAAYNNGTIWCWFGHKTVDNGADAAYRYTTTYEMFIPYKYFYSSNAGSTLSGPESDELSMSAYIQVDGTGACIWGCTDWWNSTCYVTDNGIVDKSAN